MQEILNLVDFRNSSAPIVSIIGSPGFGKSTLAIHVGHEVVKKGDVVHYVNLADFPDTDVKLVLAEKILDSARIVAKDVTFERALRWARERYYNNLLILDNCDDVLHHQMGVFQDAVKTLVKQSERIKVIITSRKHVPPFEWYKIDKLSNKAGYKLIESKVSSRVDLTEKDIQEIVERTGNVPLALQIVGSLLRLPNAPTPSTVIDELKADPITLLTPPDFPADEQMFTTINLSYKYLSKVLKDIGRQVSVFPGSFELQTTIDICNDGQFSHPRVYAVALSSLVRSSLLEYNQRTGRYQYHQLIREYFLYVQRSEHLEERNRLQLSFQFHYANRILMMSSRYNEEYDKFLAIMDSELHNVQHILQVNKISSLPMKEFLITAVALTRGINVGLLTSRFAKDDLCTLIRISLTRLDRVMDDTSNNISLPRIELYYHDQWFEYIPKQSLGDAASWLHIVSHYLLTIDQVAKCEKDANKSVAAGQVYMDRKIVVKLRTLDIEPSQYINFFTTLSKYYSLQGNDEGVIECHRLIFERMTDHLNKCEKDNHCDYYDIGATYFGLNEYCKAAEFFEQALEQSQSSTSLDRFKILIKLIQTYDELNEQDKFVSTLSTLLKLHPIIISNTTSKEFFRSGIYVQSAIELYRREGYHKEAALLEEKLLLSIKEVRVKMMDTWKLHVQDSQHVTIGMAFKVINRFYTLQNYSVVIDLGIHYIDALNTTEENVQDAIKFQVLVGKALFYNGEYFASLDQMGAALRIIFEQNLSHELAIEKETACWYLIPCLKYINLCYGVYTLVYEFCSLVLFVLFSPYPFPGIDLMEKALSFPVHKLYDQLLLYRSITTSHHVPSAETSHTHEMIANTQDFGAVSTVYVPNLQQAIASTVSNQLEALFYSVLLTLFKFASDGKTYYTLYIAFSMIIVWIKLMFLFLLYKVCTKPILRFLLVYYAYLPILITCGVIYYKHNYTLLLNLRFWKDCLRHSIDPRFVYCDLLPLPESRLSSKSCAILESGTLIILLYIHAAFMALLLAQTFYVTSVAFVSLFV